MILRPEAAWSNATAEPPTLRAAKFRSAIECTKRSQSTFAVASPAVMGYIFLTRSSVRVVVGICDSMISLLVKGSTMLAWWLTGSEGRVFGFGARSPMASFDMSGPPEKEKVSCYTEWLHTQDSPFPQEFSTGSGCLMEAACSVFFKTSRRSASSISRCSAVDPAFRRERIPVISSSHRFVDCSSRRRVSRACFQKVPSALRTRCCLVKNLEIL